MKKIILAAILLANLVAFSSCHRDRCPALGGSMSIDKAVKVS